MNKICVFIVILITLSFIACSKVTTANSSDDSFFITGKITDTNNLPLSNAKLFLRYYTPDFNSKPSTTISFELAQFGLTKVWISHHNEVDTVIVLLDEMLSSGTHTLSWNSKNSNGLVVCSNYYDVNLKSGNLFSTKKIFFNNYYYDILGISQILNNEAVANTDMYGNYYIKINKLAFSYSDNLIDVYDVNGNITSHYSIPRYIKLFAYSPGHPLKCLDSLYIAPNTNIQQDIILN